MPHFTGFVGMYCLKPSLPLYLTIPSSIETNFDGRYSLRNVLASLSNKGRTLKSLSSTSRSNSLALLYSKQNFQCEECMHFFACCCMPPQVWFLFECTVQHDGWFPPQFFRTDLLVREGERNPKLFHLLELVKLDQCVWQILQHGQASYLSSSVDVLSLSLSETEISDSSLNCLRKALALSSSLVLKPKNSCPSASDAIITQGYGNLLTHFRRPIVKHITIRTYLVFCVKRNIRISPVG